MNTRHYYSAVLGRCAILYLTLLVGFALRLYRLGAQSLWYDETVSAFLANLPAAALITHTARDIHPPGYYLLLHGWSGLAGSSEFALAFFSLFFGILLIPLTYRLARDLIGPATGVWAAFLVAISPYNLWYSQEVRMYTLGAALGVAGAWCLLQAVERPTPRTAWPYWAGYVATAAVGLYALYYFSFLLGALNILLLTYLLWPAVDRRRLTALLAANGAVILAYLPWLPVAWRQATNPPVPPWRTPPALSTMLLESWTALSLGQSVEAETVWPLLLLTGGLFAAGVFRLLRPPSQPPPPGGERSKHLHPGRGNGVQVSPPGPPKGGERSQIPPSGGGNATLNAALLIGYTFGPLLLIYLLSPLTPLYHVRYVFIYAPAFYIVLGAGLVTLSTRIHIRAALLAALLLTAASFYSIYRFHFDPQYRADDFRAAVAFIDNHWQPGDVIMANAGYTYTAFQYYTTLDDLVRQRLVPFPAAQPERQPVLLQTGTVGGRPQLGWANPQADFYAMSAAETVAALEEMAQRYSRLWLLRAYDTVTDPDGLIRQWLRERAIPLEDRQFSGASNIRAQGFLLPDQEQPDGAPIPFEDGLALVDWRLPQQQWQAGQTIHLKLWWMATARPGSDYKMSLKLWTPAGDLAAQGQDTWPVGSLYRATDWRLGQPVYQPAQLSLPESLSPGQYWLNVELYHPDTVQPLPRLDEDSSVVTLGPVQVE